MSACETCQYCDVINRYCNRMQKTLQKCAGGYKFNRKDVKTEEDIRKEEEARKATLLPFLDKIICGDSLETMKKLPDNQQILSL